MTVIDFDELQEDEVLATARAMAVAARTAPKGRGVDNLVIQVITGDDRIYIANQMRLIGEREGQAFFVRDAGNVEQAPAILLMGTKIEPLGLKVCGMCGFQNCEEKARQPEHPCVFNTGDLGIAIGSAVSVAADRRVDNRVMYTIGQAVRELGWLGKDVPVIYGIPISATSKSPFFDR